MQSSDSLDLHSKGLIIAAPLVSCFTWWQGTDPVNLPKMFILGVLSSIISPLFYLYKKNRNMRIERPELYLTVGFILAMFVPLIFSDAPKVQQFYGVNGRNTGLLTYLLLAGFFLISTQPRTIRFYRLLSYGLIGSGLLNAVISSFEIFGIELLPYNNIYKTILGTFGNPDFISAFLAISCGVPFALILEKRFKLSVKVLLAIYLVGMLCLIVISNGRQGILLFGTLGFGAIILKVSKSMVNRILKLVVWVAPSIFGVLVLLGSFGSGPLGDILYKTSVSLRQQYWLSGLRMFWDHPITGIGLNSYGDWYREVRGTEVLNLSGIDTSTNSSHNLFIDFAATGGFLLIISYLGLIALTAIHAIRYFRKTTTFDVTFTGLFLAWSGYLLQSLISIDQIGLSIWGWVLGGSIIGYSRAQFDKDQIQSKVSRTARKNTDSKIFSKLIFTSISLVIFLLVLLPPLQRDIEWQSLLSKATPDSLKIESLKFPKDEIRLLQASNILMNNSYNKESLFIAKETTQYKFRSYSSWLLIYQNPMSSSIEKQNARKILLKLDPLNPLYRK
jgi:O-antigen ligase